MSGILWVPDIFWDGRGVYLVLLIKHFFFFACKTLYCGIFWIDLEIMCHWCQISKMLLLQMLFSFKIFCHCLTGTFFSSYFHACISFLEVVKFLSFCFWHPMYFFPSFPLSTFCLPAPLLSLNKLSHWSMWLEQPSTACHLKFTLRQISLKNPPSFLSPFFLLDLFLSEA